MQVDLPTLYYVTKEGESFKADTRASLVLHRAKLGFGPVGLYETTLNRTGRIAYTELFELTGADQYAACLLYTSPSPRDQRGSRMPSSA